MWNRVLACGAIAGLITGGELFALLFLLQGHSADWGMLLGFTTMLVAFSLIFVAIKQHRDRDLGGRIGFWPAFGMGLAISAIASLIYALCWEAGLAISGIDFAGDYAAMTLAREQAAGATPEALAELTARLAEFQEQYRQPLIRFGMTLSEILPVGVLVSVVSAALLRNPGFMRRTEVAAKT